MANTFSRTILNDIRDRISIAAFIGERVELKRAGRNFKGKCPFHNERTPSFMVSDDKAMFHCFGCGEGGDVFKFLMKFDGMDFTEAVKYLAGRAGIELPRDSDPQIRAREDGAAQKKRWALRLNEIAKDYFVSRLFDERAGAGARQYLQARGIYKEFWTQHFLGYADNSWDALVFHLGEKKVPLELAFELGLLKKRDGGGYYDFFRDRLMFPIVSPRGEVLGFSGRDLGGGDNAKYVNSPDSFIYHKSSCVYGLDRAANSIRSADMALLVEGNIDLVSLHQAGITNVVAPLGTALTAGHIRLLTRYTKNMTLVFDGDEAGLRAAMRALEIFIEAGISPRMVPLPDGEDPDSLVRKEGADAFRKRIEGAIPLFEYFVDRTIAETGRDAAGKVLASGRIAATIRMVGDPAHKAIYARHAARRLDIDEQAVLKAADAKGAKTPFRGAVQGPPAGWGCEARGGHPVGMVERLLVEILLSHPDLAKAVFDDLGAGDFEDEWCKTVVQTLKGGFEDEGSLKIDRLVDGLADAELAAELRHLAFKGGKFGEDEVKNLARDCVANIKARPQSLRLKKINDDIRDAEIAGDESRLIELLGEKKELAAKMKRKIETQK